jgi:hypothetical protein
MGMGRGVLAARLAAKTHGRKYPAPCGSGLPQPGGLGLGPDKNRRPLGGLRSQPEKLSRRNWAACIGCPTVTNTSWLQL